MPQEPPPVILRERLRERLRFLDADLDDLRERLLDPFLEPLRERLRFLEADLDDLRERRERLLDPFLEPLRERLLPYLPLSFDIYLSTNSN